MARNLLKAWPALWTFASHKGVQPTNNHAERALRGAVIYRKLSLGSQSESGERRIERLLSAHTTCRLQRRSLFQYPASCSPHARGDPAPLLARATATERLRISSAPEWTRTTTRLTPDKALNLIRRCHIRPPASRSSVVCGFADTSDASDEMTCAKDVPRPRCATSRRAGVAGLNGAQGSAPKIRLGACSLGRAC